MPSEKPDRELELVQVKDEKVRAALRKVDAMSDSELRELAHGEPQLFVDAAEGIIERRRAEQRP